MTNNEHLHTDGKLAQRVLDRIDIERVSPRPRWEFLFKNYVFWGLGVLAVIIGALAVSAMLFEITTIEWQLAPVTHENTVDFLFDAVPFLWAATLALFIAIGYLNIRRTNRGYRYPLWVIGIGAILTSLALGGVFYVSGVGRLVEDSAGDHPPFHRPVRTMERSWWLAPERGLLGGKVVSATSDLSSFILQDFAGTMWAIDAGDLRTPDLAAIARGGDVRVVGIPTTATSSTFHACFVLPWEFRETFSHGPTPGVVPPMVASTSERSPSVARSEACRGIRPYDELHALDVVGR